MNSSELDSTFVTAMRRDLLAWYDTEARRLPWREHPSLYGTWISEIMLQQTTVATVIPYWERFMARLPDVGALAAADESEVLALWSGLGYYRRARSLHQAARQIAADHAGRLPTDAVGWRALPGVGDYTAGAVASIGAGERVPAVDANARRVLTRWLCGSEAAAAELGESALRRQASVLVDPHRPGDWNQAIMELGATLCRAGSARCDVCSVQGQCRAGQAGIAERVPPPRSMVPIVPVWLTLLVVYHEETVALVPPDANSLQKIAGAGRPVRSDFASLHEGLWGLPCSPWYPWPPAGRAGVETADSGGTGRQGKRREVLVRATDLARAGWRRCLDDAGARVAEISVAGSIRHGITRYRIIGVVTLARLETPQFPIAGSVPAAVSQLAGYPLGALTTKALALAPIG